MQPSSENKEQEGQANSIAPTFSISEIMAAPKRSSWKIMLPVWLALIGLAFLGYRYNWEPRIVGGSVLLLAIFSNAFVWLAATVGLVPLIGPLLVKVLALPVIWSLNAIGYMISFVAIRRGYSRDVLTYRGLTIALIVGVIIGYVIGKFI